MIVLNPSNNSPDFFILDLIVIPQNIKPGDFQTSLTFFVPIA